MGRQPDKYVAPTLPLTAPGWPRPVIGGWPVPWVSPPEDLSAMDAARKLALLDTRTCQVCGVCHNPGDVVYMCVDTPVGADGLSVDRPEDATAAVPMDEALMHERCMRLAVGSCPRLLRLQRESRLLVVSVVVDGTFVRDDEQVVPLDGMRVVPL